VGRVIFLGTGDPLNEERAQTCLAVPLVEGETMLFDASSGTVLLSQLQAAGIALTSVRHLFVTHRHFDHVGGLAPLLTALTALPEASLTVHAPPRVLPALHDLLALTIPGVEDWLGERLRWTELKIGKPTTAEDAEVTPFEVDHGIECVGFRVEQGGSAMVYAADTRPWPNIVEHARNADLLVHEAYGPEGDAKWAHAFGHSTAAEATRFLSPHGVGEVQDFMPVASSGHRPHRLIRRLLCVRGRVTFRVEVEPRFDYGRQDHRTRLDERGAVFESPTLAVALDSPLPLERSEKGVTAHFALPARQSASFVLESIDDGEEPQPYSEDATHQAFDDTVAFWRRWLSRSRYAGRWRETVHRSALTLKLLTYAPTGEIVAAPTTSLPEQPSGGARNWDYRYTWIRDAAFSLYALLRLGFTEEADAFMSWLTERFRDPRPKEKGPLQIMYGIDGRAELPEEVLGHLEGYRGWGPMRVGNGVYDQLQLDIYGELIDSVYLYKKYGTPI
jgi:ribonuclease BN (tRNA processing enzyme)